MTREDLVGEPRVASPNQETRVNETAVQQAGDVMVLVRQAAEEIKESLYSEGIAQPSPAKPGDWAEYHLPHGYNRTRIVLLVRDPYWLHCYWEIGAAERDSFRAQTSRELWECQNMLRVYDLSGGTPDQYDVPIHHDARSWYIEAGRPGHTFLVEFGADVPGRGYLPIIRSNAVTTPVDRVSDVVDEEWMIVEESFRRLYGLAAGLGPGLSSVEVVESLSRRLARQMGSGAVSSLGSGFRLPGPERQFWLVVGTELIVYGATQPDAKVTIDEQPIELRPDGTFSARYALPDGMRSIPVSGVSRDGLNRITVTPVVRKETH
ncbi:MAG: DUF4912 domain-containing protein [Bacteroidota bacterium]